MTDRSKKISELTAVSSAVANDVLVVVTNTATTPTAKKITVGNLFANVAANTTFSGRVNVANTISVNGSVVIAANGAWIGNSTGLKGEVGSKGDKGELGTTGSKGDKGEYGVDGTKGEKGDSGGGGSGTKGDKGDTGATGAKGDTGAKGEAGATGAKGDTGTGTKGDKGDATTVDATALTSGNNSFSINSNGDVVFDGTGDGNATPPGGVNRGVVWKYGEDQNDGTNSSVIQNSDGLNVRAWTEGDGGGPTGESEDGGSASVNIRTNVGENEKWWTFGGDGTLTLPEGGSLVDENGDAALSIDRAVTVTVGNSEYWAIVNRANNNGGGVEASAVAYGGDGEMATLHVSVVYNPTTDVTTDTLIVSKYDLSANLLWQKQFEQDVDVDTAHDICFDDSGNIIIAASVDNDTNIDTVNIIKLSSEGSILWQKQFKINDTTSFQEVGAVVYNDGYIYVGGAGNVDDEVSYSALGIILKVDNDDGSLVYSKTLALPAGSTFFFGMDVGADGNPVVIGKNESENNPTVAFATKINGSNGSHLWTQVLFDLDGNISYSGGDVVVDSLNNVFISINSSQSIATENSYITNATIAHIIKLNSSGAAQWMRRVGPGPCASVATGIDCDDTGNIYLSALTVAQDNPVRDSGDPSNTSRNVLAIAKYSTAGVVLWQRYIEAEGYWFTEIRDSEDPPEGVFIYDYINRGRYLSLDSSGKLAILATVYQKDTDDSWDGDEYYESITFQIDQDGREMTIGSGNEKFTVRESRIPGKFVDISTDLSSSGDLSLTAIANPLYSTSTLTLVDGELAQQISKSAPHDYVFGNDGSLTIPNDGDVKLTQTQIGWFSIFGPANNNNDHIDIRCSVVDTSTGDVYVAGEDDDDGRGFVARYNSQGQILWSIRLGDDDLGNGNRANAIKLHPDTGNVVVLCEYYGGDTSIFVVEIDPDTAKVVRSFGVQDQNENEDSIAYDFDFFSNGDVAIVGRKYDEYKSISVTPQTGSTTSTLVILNSATATNAVHPVTNNWYIAGTGITGRASIQYVNRYTGLTSTTRAGSGATFNVVANDGDPGIYSFTVTSGGTNYRAGHKVKILGSTLGGVDGVNDLIITISAVETGGVIESISNTYEGTSAGSDQTTYTGVSGTAYQLGSGATFNLSVDDAGAISIDSISAAGSNYVVGDYITISGTVFAGGATPTNDLSLVVGSVSTGGVSTISNASGTAPTTHRKIEISDTVDFGGTGSWSVVHALGGEAFVLRYSDEIEWTKVLSAGDDSDDERYLSVAIDSSDNIYAAGEMAARNNAAGSDLNSYWCAVVSKFNSSGAHQWTKALNTTLNDSYAKCVVVRDTAVIVSHNENYSNTIVTKLDTSGNVKWQRTTYSMDDSSVAIDANGDIYAAIEVNFENKYEDVIKLIKFATNGEIIYRKFFGTLTYEYGGTNENFKNGRNLTIDADHVYVSGYTDAFADNYRNGFLVKLPKTGDCDGYYGAWTVQTDIYDVDKITETETASFTPVIGTGNWGTWEPDFVTEWWDPSGGDYYQTFQEIRDRDGGAIEFADGTRQTSSAQQIPQRKISNGADHRLCLDDMGKHIYVTDSNTDINIPYHEDNPLPIGFTVVVINYSGGTINIDADGGNITVVVPGTGTGQYWDLDDQGMATLIKVDDYTWFMTGNVTNDD